MTNPRPGTSDVYALLLRIAHTPNRSGRYTRSTTDYGEEDLELIGDLDIVLRHARRLRA